MKLEFYNAETGGGIGYVEAEYCPDVGEKISIRRKTWKVVSRSWALDHSDDIRQRRLRVNLNCEPSDDKL